MIILHKRVGDAEICEFFLIVGLHEESTGVAENPRAQFPNARNGEVIFLQGIHAFVGMLDRQNSNP
jgi:hypothetical protein